MRAGGESIFARDGGNGLRLVGPLCSLALVAVAVVLAFVGGGESDEGTVAVSPAHRASVAELAGLEDSLGHDVYWAGLRPPDRLELTKEADGSVYLRYLPRAVEPGERWADFLTVGTYPVVDAQAALRRTARQEETTVDVLAGGAIVLASGESAYLAFPGSDLQIEVYDPIPGRALELVREGAIEPVGEG